MESMPDSRIIAFTAHATKLYTDIEYKPTDILLFGPEPGNIPDPMDIMAGPHVAEQVRLPMRPSLRSLNLTNCASIAIYEAWRSWDSRAERERGNVKPRESETLIAGRSLRSISLDLYQ